MSMRRLLRRRVTCEPPALPIAGATIAAEGSAVRDVRFLAAGESSVGALQGD